MVHNLPEELCPMQARPQVPNLFLAVTFTKVKILEDILPANAAIFMDGRPVLFWLSPGKDHDVTALKLLMQQG